MVRKQCWGCGMTCLLSPKGNIMEHSPKNTWDDNPQYPPRDTQGNPIICEGSDTRPQTAG